MVKLYNEAGAAEQKLRITTLKEKSSTKIFVFLFKIKSFIYYSR